MSVKSRIQQFQQTTSTPTGSVNTSASANTNNISYINSVSNKVHDSHNFNSVNKSTSYLHSPLPALNRAGSITNSTSNTINNKNNNIAINCGGNHINLVKSPNAINTQPQHQQVQIQKELRKSEVNNFAQLILTNKTEISKTMSNQNPPINRATKPSLVSKKASMTINLGSNLNQNSESITSASNLSSATKIVTSPNNPGNGTGITGSAQLRPKVGRTSSKTITSPSSAIPKPFGSTNGASNLIVPGGGRKSPGKNNTPVTTPIRGNTNEFGSVSSTGRLYGAIGWKEKYEESEKKRNHLVNLAQKATRDYEELRRRYHDLHADNEKLSRRLDGATGQLDSLRKASEAVYDEYYKLKKRFEAENQQKSDALSRVDQYNKENRRLKRQSAALMVQITDPTSLASAFDAVCENDNPDNDKEILYLRNRVQELEAKVVELDSELEKTKLAEFETQESVMLVNDSANSIKVENVKLKEQLKQLDEENRKVLSSLEDVTFEYESLKINYEDNEEKLTVAEVELKKLLNEKNILQRQSLVFMNDAMDNRLLDALNQIGDLQTGMEEQKNGFEAKLIELQHQLADRETTEESSSIQISAKIRSLEEEVIVLRKRAAEAEQKLDDLPEEPRGPPPPPPPPMPGLSMMNGPPPPPMPMLGGASLNNSLKSAMGTLRWANTNSTNGSGSCSESGTPPNGMKEGSPKPNAANPQIDDVISQLKKGIKLKPMDRTISRRPPAEAPQEKLEDIAVEEMRSILNNLRRTRRVPS